MNKGVLAVVVLFLGFWLLKDPDGFSDSMAAGFDGAWGLVTDLFTSVIDVVHNLSDS